MPHAPEPHYSFTIPSIHDDTTLCCRLYHPNLLSRPQSRDNGNDNGRWRRKGIVMAHPYAPMGGSYDDRVVGIVVEEYLALGYIVGSFNFRGAHGSKGRTSWSGKPEVDDYISFAAFFMHYLSYLHPHPTADTAFTPDQSPISPQAHSLPGPSRIATRENPVVILGGYSYGSLILKHLPPVPSLLQPFSVAVDGSAASEILLRARKLSDSSNLEWINLARDYERNKHQGHQNKPSVTMGGEETSPDHRRSSKEIRRSIDGGHRSLELGNRLRSLNHKRRKDESPKTPPEHGTAKIAIEMPNVRYLLISPLTTPISTLAAPGLSRVFWGRSQGQQDIVGKHVSLAVYGDQDIFTSSKKVHQWAEQLSAEQDSRFSHAEIEGAGHFWHEHGVEEKLRASLREWESKA